MYCSIGSITGTVAYKRIKTMLFRCGIISIKTHSRPSQMSGWFGIATSSEYTSVLRLLKNGTCVMTNNSRPINFIYNNLIRPPWTTNHLSLSFRLKRELRNVYGIMNSNYLYFYNITMIITLIIIINYYYCYWYYHYYYFYDY